jgi:hypothetical protein
MSAFKTLLASDIIVTPVTYNKSFSFQGTAALTASNVGIDRYLGTNLTTLFDPNTDAVTGLVTSSYTVYQRDVYNSIKQLYYTNFLISSSGDPAIVTQDINGVLLNLRNNITASTSNQPNFDNYLQSTLTPTRYFPTQSNSQIAVITIPTKLYGEYIVPGTLNIQSSSVVLYDDKEGNLISASVVVGNVVYPHGTVIITTGSAGVNLEGFVTNNNFSCSFQSAYTLYETQIKCTIGASDYTTTLNPSLISSSEGQVYDFATGSYFTPYLTTVGLYNENQELLMVGKLAQPLQTSQTTDTTILINIDR